MKTNSKPRRWFRMELGRNLEGTPVRFCLKSADLAAIAAMRAELGMPSRWNAETERWES